MFQIGETSISVEHQCMLVVVVADGGNGNGSSVGRRQQRHRHTVIKTSVLKKIS